MRGGRELVQCEARKSAAITSAAFSCRFVFLLVSSLLFVRGRETEGASASEAKWHGPLLVRKAPSAASMSALRDSPVLRGNVSEKPWLCRGAEQFVQTYCGPCVADSQCAPGAFCCPYLKVCVSSETDRCSKPFARCDPPLPASKPEDVDFDVWRKQCPFAELETWVTCPPPGWVLGDDLTGEKPEKPTPQPPGDRELYQP